MHPVLQIPELLEHILLRLSPSSSPDLLSCCLTCKTFTEPALDLIWANLTSIDVLPFAPMLEYEKALDPGSNEFNETMYQRHLERLRFYGRRVRTLMIHSKPTPELLKCIVKLGYGSPPTLSLSPLSTILPALRNLVFAVPAGPLHKDLTEKRIRTFLLPTVGHLHLYFAPDVFFESQTDALRSINAVHPSLISLTLGAEFIGDIYSSPPAMLQSEIASLIHSLPHLEVLHLTMSLLTHQVLVAIAGIPSLRHLKLSYPSRILRRRLTIPVNALAPLQVPTDVDSFTSLRSLIIVATFDSIPRILALHERLVSNISKLSLSCLVTHPLNNWDPFFPLSLSPHAFQSLTHLSLNFAPDPDTLHQLSLSLDGRVLVSLLSASFISHLVSFRIGHRSPLLVDDSQYEIIARAMPKLESLCISVELSKILGVPTSLSIPASLASLVSFSTHCPKLREITLPLNAEELPIPVFSPSTTPAFTHTVAVDMSVSTVGSESIPDAVKFLAAIFPHENCRFTSSWVVLQETEYSHRWKAISESIRHLRRFQDTLV